MTGATRDKESVAAEAVRGVGTGNTFQAFLCPTFRVVAHLRERNTSGCRLLEELIVGQALFVVRSI